MYKERVTYFWISPQSRRGACLRTFASYAKNDYSGEMNNIEDNKPLGPGYNIIKLEALLKIFVNGYKSTVILRTE